MLFGVMLTNKVVSVDLKTGTLQTIPALLIVAALLTSLGALFVSNWSSGTALPSTSVTTARALGEMLLTGYLLPFEVASVVLLVALIGAAFTARRTRNVS
jgi:NADH-quinone oxidoreductase subunit J